MQNIENKLEEVNKELKGYKLAYVDISKCKLLEKNARYMEKNKFQQLSKNISKDGYLSQLPFANKIGEEYEIISGNHRIEAGKIAKLTKVLLLYEENIDKNRKLAIQLSHNSLIGQDDEFILKELYDEIEDIENKEMSGLVENDFTDVELDIANNNISNLETEEMSIFFLKGEIENWKKELAKIDIKENDILLNINFLDFLKFLDQVKEKTEVVNTSLAFFKILELAKKQLEIYVDK